ncbi:hypothetical protein [Stenotrophomonas maltophilia]|uniref:hypothetical protein n=1 Tax=Stenotrophomonas maltophilia TaxID=40324 RepID=UPI003452B691
MSTTNRTNPQLIVAVCAAIESIIPAAGPSLGVLRDGHLGRSRRRAHDFLLGIAQASVAMGAIDESRYFEAVDQIDRLAIRA